MWYIAVFGGPDILTPTRASTSSHSCVLYFSSSAPPVPFPFIYITASHSYIPPHCTLSPTRNLYLYSFLTPSFSLSLSFHLLLTLLWLCSLLLFPLCLPPQLSSPSPSPSLSSLRPSSPSPPSLLPPLSFPFPSLPSS